MTDRPGFWHRSFEDFSEGDHFSSRARTITETDLVNWCCLTGDSHILHTDAIYADQSSFAQRIVPGFLTFSFSVGFSLPPDTKTLHANYGLEKLRFLRPVFISDTICCEIRVAGKRKTGDPDVGIISFDWTVLNQRSEPVIAATVLLAYRCRDGSGSEST